MPKKALSVFFVILLCFNLAACSNYKKVTDYPSHLGKGSIEYQDKRYVYYNTGFWQCDPDNLTEISWNWFIPLLAVSVCYSDTKENPEFIYCPRGDSVWFAVDYDFTQEMFCLCGTEQTIKFSNAFYKEKSIEFDDNDIENATFEWYPENHPELINQPSVYIIDETYYLQLKWDMLLYEMTDEFLALLHKSKIL